MKIAIDISQVVYGTGVSTYTKALVDSLLNLDQENEYVLFGGALRRSAQIKSIFPEAKIFPIPPMAADFIWNRLHVFPIEKLTGPVDVFHSSDWTQGPSKAFKVTTVHDLIPLKFPKFIHRKILDAHIHRLELVRKEVDRVIVPSVSTKNDLIDFGVSEDKIRVIPEAGIYHNVNTQIIDSVLKKYQISGDYLVAFGSAPYKNIVNIVKAFELASAGKNLKLVILGNQSIKLIREQRNVRLVGFVPDDEMAVIVSQSKGLIYASLYEGFGQNILEGFYFGIPVITSNLASMPEVAGEAAVLVDPYSVESISDGIDKILRGPKNYINKGYLRFKDFSWEKTAQMTLEVYKETKQ